MKDKIIYFLLNIKLFLSKWLRYVKSRLIGISEVKVIDESNTVKYVTFRFMMIKLLKSIQTILQNLIQKLDDKIEKAHIIKNYPEGPKTIIVDKKNLKVEELVTIANTLSKEKDNRLGRAIFIKFDIECPINGNIDMREYLIKYRDIDGNYNHTINNILVFNNKDVSKDAMINIKTFSSGKLISKTLSYNDFKDKHLIEFNSLNLNDDK